MCASSSLPSWRSKRFSGSRQVAELGVRAAGLEQLGLLLAELEALADQRRLVGVEDRPVGASTASRARPTRRGSGPARRRRAARAPPGRRAGRRRSARPSRRAGPRPATRSRVSRSASSIATERSAKKPPTTITAIAARLPSMNRATADATRGGVRSAPSCGYERERAAVRPAQPGRAAPPRPVISTAWRTGPSPATISSVTLAARSVERSSSRPPRPVLSMNSTAVRSSRERSQSVGRVGDRRAQVVDGREVDLAGGGDDGGTAVARGADRELVVHSSRASTRVRSPTGLSFG